jgi:2,3-bisphosphoglycerate-dependent phosphoglycerate mutase
MMPRLIAALLRHGAYDQPKNVPGAHNPHPLTPEGEDQARAAATRLIASAEGFGCSLHAEIDTSDLLRAWGTARVIADSLTDLLGREFRLIEVPALRERGLGSAGNLTLEQIDRVIQRDPRYAALPRDWRSRSEFRLPLPGAESLLEAGARTAEYLVGRLDALQGELTTDTLKIFVGHGGSIRHAAVRLGMLEVDQAREVSMEYCQPVFWEKTADRSWRHIAGDWKKRVAPSNGDA